MWVKRLVKLREESLVCVQGDARSTSDVQAKIRGNTNVKEVNRIDVVKVGGE